MEKTYLQKYVLLESISFFSFPNSAHLRISANTSISFKSFENIISLILIKEKLEIKELKNTTFVRVYVSYSFTKTNTGSMSDARHAG